MPGSRPRPTGCIRRKSFSPSQQNIVAPAGDFDTSADKIYLRASGALQSVEELRNLPIEYAGQELPPSFKYTNSGGRKKGYLTTAWREFRPGGKSRHQEPVAEHHADDPQRRRNIFVLLFRK